MAVRIDEPGGTFTNTGTNEGATRYCPHFQQQWR